MYIFLVCHLHLELLQLEFPGFDWSYHWLRIYIYFNFKNLILLFLALYYFNFSEFPLSLFLEHCWIVLQHSPPSPHILCWSLLSSPNKKYHQHKMSKQLWFELINILGFNRRDTGKSNWYSFENHSFAKSCCIERSRHEVDW